MSRPPDWLIARYKQRIGVYGNAAAAALVRAWNQLGSYEQADLELFTAQTAPMLAGMKVLAVATSSAFFSAARRLPPLAVNPDDVSVEPRLADPFHAMWHAVGEGRPNDEALLVGGSVASALGLDFIVSVARQAMGEAASKANVRVRWERVPDAAACEWCQTVAGQTYLSADSADFGHDRCNCSVVPTDEAMDQTPVDVTDTTSRGEGRRALGIASHHPR